MAAPRRRPSVPRRPHASRHRVARQEDAGRRRVVPPAHGACACGAHARAARRSPRHDGRRAPGALARERPAAGAVPRRPCPPARDRRALVRGRPRQAPACREPLAGGACLQRHPVPGDGSGRHGRAVACLAGRPSADHERLSWVPAPVRRRGAVSSRDGRTATRRFVLAGRRARPLRLLGRRDCARGVRGGGTMRCRQCRRGCGRGARPRRQPRERRVR